MSTPDATTRALSSNTRESHETSTLFENYRLQLGILAVPPSVAAIVADSFQIVHKHSLISSRTTLGEVSDAEEDLTQVLREISNKTSFESLRAEYVFEKEDEVNSFITSNYHLLKTLQVAPGEIKKVFGEDVLLVLEVLNDPEENTKELFIVIKSQFNAVDGRTRLNFLIDDWFIDLLDEVDGKLNITEEQV